ncbi:hypothetical protein [Candidatus Palauibacter sp.]|uniref:hypothetical protein n=1 Tax=Candidatus Palauibacter sp. TaxID=3101350 RepID=UPI003B02DF7D
MARNSALAPLECIERREILHRDHDSHDISFLISLLGTDRRDVDIRPQPTRRERSQGPVGS